MTEQEREELEYLKFFFQQCDFGPAHEDVVDIINKQYLKKTGKTKLPDGYGREDEDEEEVNEK